jgi:hypothetical protein
VLCAHVSACVLKRKHPECLTPGWRMKKSSLSPSPLHALSMQTFQSFRPGRVQKRNIHQMRKTFFARTHAHTAHAPMVFFIGSAHFIDTRAQPTRPIDALMVTRFIQFILLIGQTDWIKRCASNDCVFCDY